MQNLLLKLNYKILNRALKSIIQGSFDFILLPLNMLVSQAQGIFQWHNEALFLALNGIW
jgi:hypothetical protein